MSLACVTPSNRGTPSEVTMQPPDIYRQSSNSRKTLCIGQPHCVGRRKHSWPPGKPIQANAHKGSTSTLTLLLKGLKGPDPHRMGDRRQTAPEGLKLKHFREVAPEDWMLQQCASLQILKQARPRVVEQERQADFSVPSAQLYLRRRHVGHRRSIRLRGLWPLDQEPTRSLDYTMPACSATGARHLLGRHRG